MRKLNYLSWALIALLALVPSAFAQTSGTMTMPMTPSNVIVGANTPEQITDVVSLRLWLAAAYPRTASNPDGSLNTVLIHQLGLSPAGEAIVSQTVVSYNQSFDTIEQAYQVDVDANNVLANQDTFWKNVYGLVSNTLLGLKTQLSADDQAIFLAGIEAGKSGMNISNVDYGLGQEAELRRKELTMVAGTPQGEQMTSNYSSVSYDNVSFPARSVTGNPWSSWAQDTGTGNAGFKVVNGIVSPNGTGSGEANAYWPGPGTSVYGVSTMTLSTPPSGGNSICVRTNISNNGLNFYIACMYGNGSTQAIVMYRYYGGNHTWISTTNLKSGAVFASGDTLEMQTANGQILVTYVSHASTSAANGSGFVTYTDPSPLPAGYVGIQECPCSGEGSYSNWTGGTGLVETVTGTVTGTTLGSGWPPSTRHTPYVTVQLGNIGGKQGGAAVTPNTYVNFSNVQTIDYDTVGNLPDPFNYDFLQEILCSQVGNFYSVGGGSGSKTGKIPLVWLALTHKIITKASPPYNAATNCTAATTPPDYDPVNSYTILNITGVDYGQVGVCSLLGFVKGNLCVPTTNALVPDGVSAGPLTCTSHWGEVAPIIVLKWLY